MCSHTGYPLQQCNVGEGSEHNLTSQTGRTHGEKMRVRKREIKEGRGKGEKKEVKSMERRTLRESIKIQNLVRKISFYASKLITILLIPCLLDLWTLQRRYSGGLVSGISHSPKIPYDKGI